MKASIFMKFLFSWWQFLFPQFCLVLPRQNMLDDQKVKEFRQIISWKSGKSWHPRQWCNSLNPNPCDHLAIRHNLKNLKGEQITFQLEIVLKFNSRKLDSRDNFRTVRHKWWGCSQSPLHLHSSVPASPVELHLHRLLHPSPRLQPHLTSYPSAFKCLNSCSHTKGNPKEPRATEG